MLNQQQELQSSKNSQYSLYVIRVFGVQLISIAQDYQQMVVVPSVLNVTHMVTDMMMIMMVIIIIIESYLASLSGQMNHLPITIMKNVV
jgi:hypothetical protein